MKFGKSDAFQMSGRGLDVLDDDVEILQEIGSVLSEDEEYPLDGTLLHADVAWNVVGLSVFKGLGDHILYRWASHGLTDILLNLWERPEQEKRWAEIEYLIKDGRFEVVYVYPEEIDPDEDPLVRQDRIVRKYFGEKPIVYPPFPESDFPTYEL